MTDQIVASTKCVNADATPSHWEFSYDVESAGKHNSFCVIVDAEEMTDATDADEAKTKANVKAAAIKADWVATLAELPVVTPDITTPETVTL